MYKTKNHVINAFKAADLDGNGTIDLYEYMILFRFIEGKIKLISSKIFKINYYNEFFI